ncbi:MAG: response regulator transcription factor [Alistipes sp.]|nr:response regulator transcription factor [Alistipes sp.]
MNKYRILVVDDEESLCEILKFNFEKEGYEVTTALSAEEALALDLANYDLMILDIMMGELSGFGLARILRKRTETAETPIIFCSALDSEADKIKGLDIGADDYISKPFSLAEVMARVRSVLRRSKRISGGAAVVENLVVEELEGSDDGIQRFESLVVNNLDKSCSIDGEEIQLTRKEFDILVLLLSSRGTILSREQIMKRVWSEEVVVLDRTIDVNITRLRKKLGIYGNHIITRTGYGYGFKI